MKYNYFSRFGHRPIGPVANYVKTTGDAAKSDDIAAVIEASLGRGLLTSFIVNDRHDLGVLKRMLRDHDVQVKCHPW